jgi:hypothetical protein
MDRLLFDCIFHGNCGISGTTISGAFPLPNVGIFRWGSGEEDARLGAANKIAIVGTWRCPNIHLLQIFKV